MTRQGMEISFGLIETNDPGVAITSIGVGVRMDGGGTDAALRRRYSRLLWLSSLDSFAIPVVPNRP